MDIIGPGLRMFPYVTVLYLLDMVGYIRHTHTTTIETKKRLLVLSFCVCVCVSIEKKNFAFHSQNWNTLKNRHSFDLSSSSFFPLFFLFSLFTFDNNRVLGSFSSCVIFYLAPL
jgi:hypothetical protein